MNPYCQHDECHDAVTAYYRRDEWQTAASSFVGSPKWYSTPFIVMDFWPFLGSRRLCGIHARQEFGVQYGGRRAYAVFVTPIHAPELAGGRDVRGEGDLERVDHAAEHYATTGNSECWCAPTTPPTRGTTTKEKAMAEHTAEEVGAPEVEMTVTEWGFLYDGKPEWSSHAYVPWSRQAALHYRKDAELWRISTRVGGLIYRERTTYRPRLSEWTAEIPETRPSSPTSTQERAR